VDQASTTRERLVGAAARLFADQGYAATTTSQIAAAVAISQPALYKHFRSKNALLAAVCEDVLGRPGEIAHALHALDAEAAATLYRFLLETTRHMRGRPAALAALIQTPEIAGPEYEAIRRRNAEGEHFVTRLLRVGTETGVFRQIDPHHGMRLVLAPVDALARSWTQPQPGGDGPEWDEEMLRFVFHGLLAEPDRYPAVRSAALELDFAPNRPLERKGSLEAASGEGHGVRRSSPDLLLEDEVASPKSSAVMTRSPTCPT
jgi:AcrR family transcriptional regulator